jgi:hypothetical protein
VVAGTGWVATTTPLRYTVNIEPVGSGVLTHAAPPRNRAGLPPFASSATLPLPSRKRHHDASPTSLPLIGSPRLTASRALLQIRTSVNVARIEYCVPSSAWARPSSTASSLDPASLPV